MTDFTDIEIRRPIIGFPNYEITNFGRVFNVRTGREMTHSPTAHEIPTVGLMYEGVQYRRSVKVLVARAFVAGETDLFNTPIQLDGDRANVHESNIAWRPRWFAWVYSRQFISVPGWAWYGPVLDTTRNIEYRNIFVAATTNGNLCSDVYHSINTGTRVFPTGEVYVFTRRDPSRPYTNTQRKHIL
jgi:hypothetical protein